MTSSRANGNVFVSFSTLSTAARTSSSRRLKFSRRHCNMQNPRQSGLGNRYALEASNDISPELGTFGSLFKMMASTLRDTGQYVHVIPNSPMEIAKLESRQDADLLSWKLCFASNRVVPLQNAARPTSGSDANVWRLCKKRASDSRSLDD